MNLTYSVLPWISITTIEWKMDKVSNKILNTFLPIVSQCLLHKTVKVITTAYVVTTVSVL